MRRESQGTQGRTLCGYAGRNWSDACTNQMLPMVAGNHQKIKRGEEEFSSTA